MVHVPLRIAPEELQSVQLFRYVCVENLVGLLESCELRELQAGEILIRPGQTNHMVYLLLSGRLRIHLESAGHRPVDILDAGEIVGEMSVIEQGLSTALVIADEPCRLMTMDEDILWALVRASHGVACNLLLAITKRLRHANHVISEGLHLEMACRNYGTVDALTGLHNRHWLDKALKRQMKRCRMNKVPFSMILCDIDHFKHMNDTYGHLCGDRALYGVASAFTSNLRITEVAARYGGDEFAVMLPELDVAQTRNVAERLREAIMDLKLTAPDGFLLPGITLSLGVAQADGDSTPETLIAAADAALYRAKEQGRNRVSD